MSTLEDAPPSILGRPATAHELELLDIPEGCDRRRDLYDQGVARYANCKHERVFDPGGNPSRGWRPAHCRLCGMDMSVDSSG